MDTLTKGADEVIELFIVQTCTVKASRHFFDNKAEHGRRSSNRIPLLEFSKVPSYELTRQTVTRIGSCTMSFRGHSFNSHTRQPLTLPFIHHHVPQSKILNLKKEVRY